MGDAHLPGKDSGVGGRVETPALSAPSSELFASAVDILGYQMIMKMWINARGRCPAAANVPLCWQVWIDRAR